MIRPSKLANCLNSFGNPQQGKKERAGKKQMAYVGGIYSIDRFVRTADDVVDDLRRRRLSITACECCWTVPGAQAMLSLRAIHLNDQWDDYVNFRIQSEQTRLYWQTAA